MTPPLESAAEHPLVCWACHAFYTAPPGPSGKCPNCEQAAPDPPLELRSSNQKAAPGAILMGEASNAVEASRPRELPVLAPLFARLREDGGRYLLSVGLTREEWDAQPEPTYGGKRHVRWLTDEEYSALCSLSGEIAGAMHASAPPDHKCSDCTMDREPCPTCYQVWWQKRHPHTHQHPGPATPEPRDG